MRKLFFAFLAVSLILFSTSAVLAAELRFYNWSEYIDPEILTDFEKETGIKVRMDLYESNEEMMAKLQAGGVSQYDVIVPSDYFIPSLTALNLIQPLDHAQLPNLKNLSTMFTQAAVDPGNKYTVPYQWGTVGLMYHKDKIKNFDPKNPSWASIFDPSQDPGPFLLIDDARVMLGITMKYLGYPFNSAEPKHLKEAVELLLKTKHRKSCLGFEGGVGGKNKVVAGVAVAAVVYNGDAMRAVEENENIAFLVPNEGSEIWLDSMCIPAQSPNKAEAYKFINYILDAKVGAKLANWNRYGSPNEASMPYIAPEDKEDQAIYPSPEVMKRLEYSLDLGDKSRLVDEAWTMVKTR